MNRDFSPLTLTWSANTEYHGYNEYTLSNALTSINRVFFLGGGGGCLIIGGIVVEHSTNATAYPRTRM